MNISKKLLVTGLLVSGIAQAGINKYRTPHNTAFVKVTLADIERKFADIDNECQQNPDCENCSELNIILSKRAVVTTYDNKFKQDKKNAKAVKKTNPDLYRSKKGVRALFHEQYEQYNKTGQFLK